jgi:excisionase family DNA binding protein
MRRKDKRPQAGGSNGQSGSNALPSGASNATGRPKTEQPIAIANSQNAGDPPRRGLTLPQAYAYSGLRIWRLRQLIKDRKIKFIREGRGYLILKDTLDAYLEKASTGNADS